MRSFEPFNQKPAHTFHSLKLASLSNNYQSFGDFSIMATKESQITYQAHVASECLDRVIARFGDRLGKLTAVDKLDLLGILAFWQSADTQHQEAEMEPIRLGEYLDLNRDLQLATSHNLDEALTLLADCSEGDAMTLMVAIPQQLRDGCYS